MQHRKPISGTAVPRLSAVAIVPVVWALTADPAAVSAPWIRGLGWGVVLCMVGLSLREIWGVTRDEDTADRGRDDGNSDVSSMALRSGGASPPSSSLNSMSSSLNTGPV